MITQLLALMRGDHLMPTPAEWMAAPLEPAELPPTNLLEKKKPTRLPHRQFPISFAPDLHLVGSCWRHASKVPIDRCE